MSISRTQEQTPWAHHSEAGQTGTASMAHEPSAPACARQRPGWSPGPQQPSTTRLRFPYRAPHYDGQHGLSYSEKGGLPGAASGTGPAPVSFSSSSPSGPGAGVTTLCHPPLPLRGCRPGGRRACRSLSFWGRGGSGGPWRYLWRE